MSVKRRLRYGGVKVSPITGEQFHFWQWVGVEVEVLMPVDLYRSGWRAA